MKLKMRGRSTSAKARLRSAGYKCNLCGRRVIDAVTLERHQKTVHNVSTRVNKVSFKPKPVQTIKRKASTKESTKEKEKIITKEKEDTVEQTRPKRVSRSSNESQTTVKESADEEMASDEKNDHVENGESISTETEDSSKKKEKTLRQIHFICPACNKMFGVYFNAHKHIQKEHPSVPKIRPVRVEPCCRCNCKIRSDEEHKCRKLIDDSSIIEYICSGCNQIFISLKSFDMHVAGLHSDAVDSMFFPSRPEFVTWRLEMEYETNSKYSLYGEYDSKKIYRCNYAKNTEHRKCTAYFCPSSIVVQEFSKGIQVHFYHKHYDHNADEYTLSSKYKRYSITKFLTSKTPIEAAVTPMTSSVKLDGKDLFSQFKKLIDSIVSTASQLDNSVLENLIEKALEMSSIVTDAKVNEMPSSLKSAKRMSDKEITKELEMKTDISKRRKSVDSSEVSAKPAKRMRNKSLFNPSPTKLSPKIVNTFSLASSSSSGELRSDKDGDIEFDAKSDNTDKLKLNQNKNVLESDKTANKTKMSTRLSSTSESLSFNDSYKDFIDKNFISKETKSERPIKNKVKTKLGAFKQISPRRAENKEETSNRLVVNRFIKPTKSETDEVSTKIDMETPKLNILSIETPNVKISKVTSGKTDTTNAQISNLKVNLKSKGTTHPVDPFKINITKVSSNDSVVESDNNELQDPLELSITKPRPKTITKLPRNNAKVISRTPSIEPLTPNTTKANITPKVYSGPGAAKLSPKVPPKVTFEDTSPRNSKILPKKVPDLKYEVVEQENDCNILVLKF